MRSTRILTETFEHLLSPEIQKCSNKNPLFNQGWIYMFQATKKCLSFVFKIMAIFVWVDRAINMVNIGVSVKNRKNVDNL